MSNIVKEFESRIMLTESEYFEIVSHFMRLHPNKHFLKNTSFWLINRKSFPYPRFLTSFELSNCNYPTFL